LAQIDGGIVGRLLRGMRPQVQGISRAAAFEAMEQIPIQVSGEAAAGAVDRAVQWAGASLLTALRTEGVEAEQLQHGRHVQHASQGREVDSRSGRGCGLGLGVVLPFGLPHQSAPFASLGEFAVAFVEDLLVAAVEFVLGRDVADGRV
jgi:hypothetical protein